jgi:hypothetical protein
VSVWPFANACRRCLYGTGTAPQIGWGEAGRVPALCRDAACDLAPSAWRRSCGPGRRDRTRGVSATTFEGHEHGHLDDDNVGDDHHFDQHNNDRHDPDHLNSANHDGNHHHRHDNDNNHFAGNQRAAEAETSPDGERRPR